MKSLCSANHCKARDGAFSPTVTQTFYSFVTLVALWMSLVALAHAQKVLVNEIPDVSMLIHESETNGATMHKQLLDYTYTLKKTRRTLDTHGRVTGKDVQIFEAYPVQGEHVLIQVGDNRGQLSAERVAFNRRLAVEALERAEHEQEKNGDAANALTSKMAALYLVAGVTRSSSHNFAMVLIDLSEFLQSCEFFDLRHVRLNERETIELSFRPRANVKFVPPKAFIAKISGKLWIDAQDKVVARLEGWPLQTSMAAKDKKSVRAEMTSQDLVDEQQPQAALVYLQTRLPSGIWFPSLICMNAGGDATLFNGLNWDVTFEFSEYKRFSVDVREGNLRTNR